MAKDLIRTPQVVETWVNIWVDTWTQETWLDNVTEWANKKLMEDLSGEVSAEQLLEFAIQLPDLKPIDVYRDSKLSKVATIQNESPYEIFINGLLRKDLEGEDLKPINMYNPVDDNEPTT